MKAGRRGGILWVTRDNTAPHPYLVEACRRAGGEVRELRWAEEFDGQRPMGRFVELGRGTGRSMMSFKLVSPRLLARFARAAEDVVIILRARPGGLLRRSLQAGPTARVDLAGGGVPGAERTDRSDRATRASWPKRWRALPSREPGRRCATARAAVAPRWRPTRSPR